MSALKDLLTIRHKILDPRNWTQHTGARDIYNERVSPISDRAVKWCLLGATSLLPDEGFSATRALMRVLPIMYDGQLSLFNDSNTHDKVIALIDEAISRCPDE